MALGLPFGRVKNVLLLRAKKPHEPTQVSCMYIQLKLLVRKLPIFFSKGGSLQCNRVGVFTCKRSDCIMIQLKIKELCEWP